MFDFEKLEVYQKIKKQNIEVIKYLASDKLMDEDLKARLKKATLNAAFNLVEGSARMSVPDKKNYYVIARSAVFESVAILEVFKATGEITPELYDIWYAEYTSVSKMLLSLYRTTR